VRLRTGLLGLCPLVAIGGAGLLTLRDRGADDEGSVAVIPGGRSAPVFVEQVTSPSPPSGDPGIGTAAAARDRSLVERLVRGAPADTDAAMMAALMDEQPRDGRAAPVEAAMRTAIAQLPPFAASAGTLRVNCVATTCEVSGMAGAGRTGRELEQALQAPALMQTLTTLGYTPGPLVAGAMPTGDRIGFVLYLNNEA